MNAIRRFTFAREPRLEFGAGSLSALPRILSEQASLLGAPISRVALITGSSSFRSSERGKACLSALRGAGFALSEFSAGGEPSPEFVDAAVRSVLAENGGGDWRKIAVVGIGGGSAMDAGKAVAAMLPAAADAMAAKEGAASVTEYLEGVGTRSPDGRTAFYVAVPTTAGTGTEASKNAVLSRIGEGGFKKSLRHDSYTPAVAVVDPELALGCPLSVSAASGLDAFTQLLESYLSPAASAMTDALCESGIARFAAGFPAMLADPSDLEARTDMAYAAYLSGIGLANAGLGSVHGLASPVGGRFPVPHGVVCGLLVLPAVRQNARILKASGDAGKAGLAKYARAGFLLSRSDSVGRGPGIRYEPGNDAALEQGLELLEAELERLVARAALPRLGSFGMNREHIDDLASRAAAKTNPVALGKAEYAELLSDAL